MKTMKIAVMLVAGLLLMPLSAQASSLVSLQLHNPPGGNPAQIEGASAKSQFVIRNDSDPGVQISSINWVFSSGVFLDTTAAAPGFGTFRDYVVSGAQTYSGAFTIDVLADSDLLAGYTGSTNFTNGATSLLLTFNDFDPTEAFAFWTDLDTTNNSLGHIGNSDFNGSQTFITFSDGSVAQYTWNLPDNDGRSFFAEGVAGIPTSAAPEPATVLLFSSGLAGAWFRRKKRS